MENTSTHGTASHAALVRDVAAPDSEVAPLSPAVHATASADRDSHAVHVTHTRDATLA